ncbi:MAG: hypothetical protein RJQ14_26145 [Marinoscillum sp.]
MIIRPALSCTIFLMLICCCYAQQSSDSLSLRNDLVLKLDLTNAVNPIDPGLLLGMEIRFNEKHSFTQEIGWIMGLKDEDNLKQEFVGFKVREEWRIYKQAELWPGQYYFGANLFYRYVKLRDQITVGHNCFDDSSWSCDYVMYDIEEIQTHQFGGVLKVGMQKKITDRVLIETDAGLGIQHLIRSEFSNQGNVVDYEFNRIYGEDYLGSRPYLTFNAKVGYKIK